VAGTITTKAPPTKSTKAPPPGAAD